MSKGPSIHLYEREGGNQPVLSDAEADSSFPSGGHTCAGNRGSSGSRATSIHAFRFSFGRSAACRNTGAVSRRERSWRTPPVTAELKDRSSRADSQRNRTESHALDALGATVQLEFR
jgi:hypothetical protein